jgi:hypothetical protein
MATPASISTTAILNARHIPGGLTAQSKVSLAKISGISAMPADTHDAYDFLNRGRSQVLGGGGTP